MGCRYKHMLPGNTSAIPSASSLRVFPIRRKPKTEAVVGMIEFSEPETWKDVVLASISRDSLPFDLNEDDPKEEIVGYKIVCTGSIYDDIVYKAVESLDYVTIDPELNETVSIIESEWELDQVVDPPIDPTVTNNDRESTPTKNSNLDVKTTLTHNSDSVNKLSPLIEFVRKNSRDLKILFIVSGVVGGSFSMVMVGTFVFIIVFAVSPH